MTAADLRAHSDKTFEQFKAASAKTGEVSLGSILLQHMLGVFEIAAQLADQNQQIREDREFRRAVVEEERDARIKRDALLTSTGASMEAIRENIGQPPPMPPRVTFPGEVMHLGCLIREPDGVYAIADSFSGKLTRLEPDEAQRILALMGQPANPDPEAKPS